MRRAEARIGYGGEPPSSKSHLSAGILRAAAAVAIRIIRAASTGTPQRRSSWRTYRIYGTDSGMRANRYRVYGIDLPTAVDTIARVDVHPEVPAPNLGKGDYTCVP